MNFARHLGYEELPKAGFLLSPYVNPSVDKEQRTE